MIRKLSLIHRWTGGLIGLLLAIIGLTGAILANKDAWIGVTGAGDIRPATVGHTATLIERIMAASEKEPRSIVLPGDSFGLARMTYSKDSGAYANQDGQIVEQWSSVWGRPEIWLFDIHHHLLAGEAGEIVSGILGLIAIGFIGTGVLLWWQTRRTFGLRLWPARMTRAALINHHRDLGIVIAPVLFLSVLTGAMMVLKPVAGLILMPFSTPAEMEAATKPPKVTGGPLSANLNWLAIMTDAHARFPGAAIRQIMLPREPGDLITVRIKQPDEWHPSGRTSVWFAPESGKFIDSRDAMKQPQGLQILNKAYPLHTGKVGGLMWQIMITLTGLALALLGFLATWSFWMRGGRRA
jgi:uncharacterized iron-regulated membrane protein